MEAHDLAVDGIDVWEHLAVIKVGEAVVPDNGVELGLSTLLHLQMQNHHVDEGAQCREGLYCTVNVVKRNAKLVRLAVSIAATTNFRSEFAVKGY